MSLRIRNIPLLDLTRLSRSKSSSLINNPELSDYFTSKSYLIDAIYISSRIPIIHQYHISCSIENKSNNAEINVKRMKQMIFGKPIKINPKYPCKSSQTRYKPKPKKNQSKFLPH